MGIEEAVYTSGGNKKVGMKKYFVFHVGEAPSGIKTNWILQEYGLSDSSSSSTTSSRSSRRRSKVSIAYPSSQFHYL